MTDFNQSGLISLCILSIIYYCHMEYQYLISYSYLSLPPTLPPSHPPSLPPSLRAPSLPQMSPPQILWYSYSSLRLLCQLDIVKTAEVRRELLLLDKLKKGMLPPNVCQQFASRCCEDLANVCRKRRLTSSWDVKLSEFGPEREEDMKTR